MFAGTQLISQKKKDNCEMCLDSRGINICEVRSVKTSEKKSEFFICDSSFLPPLI